MEEWFVKLERECQISSSQQEILSNSLFAEEEEFLPHPDDGWPDLSSSGSEGGCRIVYNQGMGITICSAPPTPDPIHMEEEEEEEFKTPPKVVGPMLVDSNGVVYGCCDGVLDDVGSIGERRGLKRKREKDGDSDLGLVEDGETEVLMVSDSEEERENAGDLGNGGDTEEIKDEMNDETKLDSDLNANAGPKEARPMKCLMDVLKFLASEEGWFDHKGKEKEEDEEVNIFETAIKRGMVFPRNRWYDK